MRFFLKIFACLVLFQSLCWAGSKVKLTKVKPVVSYVAVRQVPAQYVPTPEELDALKQRRVLEETMRLSETSSDFSKHEAERADALGKVNTAKGARTLIGQKRYWARRVKKATKLEQKNKIIHDVGKNIEYLEEAIAHRYPKRLLIRRGFKFGYGGDIIGTPLSPRKLQLLVDYLKKLHALLQNKLNANWWDLIELNRVELGVSRKNIVRRAGGVVLKKIKGL